ncbi:unnamed protein product [Rotaria socialis]|uniref:GTPase Era, mitochondrial n=1 Tax=Rotaria socialis TaxID=392032 RepID=A0A817XP19_9BILA|nr:unnamed protein product [Rotaria socialis]CAF3370738.1 unnamed protein product [Rotaria socialis]CAF3410584.1 unnamed protein product [Rotaria socialis]CAF3580790.1 unnamed protein product [Rotaria socialis]CAF3669673.1 unnamed protein product [Rotaria socialis]
MITLHRIAVLTCRHARSSMVSRPIHIEPKANEKLIPLSKFDLSKPLIGRTSAEHTAIALLSPDMPPDGELLKVAIIGAPNAGKSTFVNRLMGWRISSVSKRPHTTRHRITGVLTDANKQIVFLDTPGFVAPWRKKRHNLEKSMILDPHSCLWDADLICVVHDVGNHWLRFKLDEEILKCLYAHPEKEAILILNKVDSIKRKRMLLDITTILTDGSLNGVPYRLDSPYHRNGELDMERLFLKTAHEMNIPLPKTENDVKRELLLADMREYEKKLLDIQLENVNLDLEENQVNELISQHQEKRLTLDKLSDEVSSHVPYTSMKDINPFEFKKDVMETTNWHLYYKKLSQIRLFTRDRSTWPFFNQVFMISAKQNRGIAAIRKYLFSRTKSEPWMFHRNFVTDQYPQEIAEMCIREQMLEYLPEEIPYSYLMTNDRWELDENDVLNMTFIIYPRAKQLKRDVSVLLKNHGEAIKLISMEAEKALATTFRCEVKLKLIVKISHE